MRTVNLSKAQIQIDELAKVCGLCTKCPIGGKSLAKDNLDTPYSTNVFSSRNPKAEIMVVGQNPGIDEVWSGHPFSGQAGIILWEKLASIGIESKDVYATNIVKCHIVEERKPTQDEVDNCRHHIDEEIRIVSPRIIVALGSLTLKSLTGVSGIMKHAGEIVHSPRYGAPVLAMPYTNKTNIEDPQTSMLIDMSLNNLRKFLDG